MPGHPGRVGTRKFFLGSQRCSVTWRGACGHSHGRAPLGPVRGDNCSYHRPWRAGPQSRETSDFFRHLLEERESGLGGRKSGWCFSTKGVPHKGVGTPSAPFPRPRALRKENVRSREIPGWRGLAWHDREASFVAGRCPRTREGATRSLRREIGRVSLYKCTHR